MGVGEQQRLLQSGIGDLVAAGVGDAGDVSSPAFFGPGFYRPLRCFLAFQPGVVNFLRCAISES